MGSHEVIFGEFLQQETEKRFEAGGMKWFLKYMYIYLSLPSDKGMLELYSKYF